MDLWMLRTTDNQLTGPFSQEVIKQKLLGGELKADDEICPANSYWFSVHEIAEVRNHLGIDPPASLLSVLPRPADATDTLNGVDVITNPEITAEHSASDGVTTFVSTGAAAPASVPDPVVAAPSTPVVAAPSAAATNPIPPAVNAVGAPTEQTPLEKLMHWEGFRFVVIGGTVLVVYGILRFFMN